MWTNPVVIITGAGDPEQVSQRVAARFLAAGARVVLTGRSARVHERAAELAAHGDVVGVEADLTVDADVARLIGTARERWGRLDALINVAGGLTVQKPVSETDVAEWRRELSRNAETVLLTCRAALPLLRESRGAIVNFASPAGLRAVRTLGAYSAAKAAVVALTRALALEESSNGVRANAVAPGMIDTGQNRATEAAETQRFVTRDEIAEVVYFLASPASSGINGETIGIPGPGVR